MTREEIEKAIRVLKEWQSYYESLDLDSESPEDDPTSEADSLEAFKLAIEVLEKRSNLAAAFNDMKQDIWMEGVNMAGEYHGVWVRYRDIERVIEKYESKVMK